MLVPLICFWASFFWVVNWYNLTADDNKIIEILEVKIEWMSSNELAGVLDKLENAIIESEKNERNYEIFSIVYDMVKAELEVKLGHSLEMPDWIIESILLDYSYWTLEVWESEAHFKVKIKNIWNAAFDLEQLFSGEYTDSVLYLQCSDQSVSIGSSIAGTPLLYSNLPGSIEKFKNLAAWDSYETSVTIFAGRMGLNEDTKPILETAWEKKMECIIAHQANRATEEYESNTNNNSYEATFEVE